MEENVALLNEELILMDYGANNKEELLRGLGTILREKGYVKNTYIDGLLEREETFPTGLNTPGVSVAIPHTYAIHVEKPVILIAKLNKPVVFKEMGSGENDVEAKLIFMLAIKNPDQQVITLSKLMSIFSKEETLLEIYNAKEKHDIYLTLKKVLEEDN
ncbi:PTS sugar transporter subunit IIA [Clostridium omnivorum]|uniref:PTS fructose transporter subunit IIA n=1 Tax=Clostridium omnivorum TaxID=1604902 RepID=A0ABQ5N9N6_9CLOT|nr:PTS sugar transporter subunit IIA [Clostridium sp. E14]GLC31821.1 PTS fructose transporter subunit IIA [Clostridium sp. E14]